MTGKNLYLLGLEESPGRQQDIYEMIRALEIEISRGSAVYTAGELGILENKLQDYREVLRVVTQA